MQYDGPIIDKKDIVTKEYIDTMSVNLATFPRPNLLENACFIGGGSQLGGARLPINQKGQTSYSGANTSTIDRWKTGAGTGVTVASDGVTVSSIASSNRYFRQSIEGYKSLLGKTVTLSVLSVSVTSSFSYNILASGSSIASGTASSAGLATVTVQIPLSATSVDVNLNGGTNGNNVKIAAIKFELGETQTLVHNEGTEANPIWVLNEIPDYTEELLKCQRFYQLFTSSSYRPTNAQDYRPVMRATPSTGTISIGGTTYYYANANL